MPLTTEAVNLPPELVVDVFCHLSLSNALAFASTARRYRQIFSENLAIIYKHIGPGSIRCHRYARILLHDQGGPPTDASDLTVNDVLRILRNSRIVERAVDKFNRDIVSRVRTRFQATAEEFYGLPRHPPSLTATEHHRFARTYYQLWSIMLLDPASKERRFGTILLKHLFLVYEMTMLKQPIGDEKTSGVSHKERGILVGEMQNRVKHTFQQIHKRDYQDPTVDAGTEGYLHHVMMFDHYQPILKELVCNRFVPAPKPNPVKEESVWLGTSDEEE